MQDDKDAPRQMAEIIRRQEAALQFEHFDAGDAWAIGQSLRVHALAHGGSVSIDITFSGLQLFHTVVEKPSPNNDRWVARKRNTVLEFWKSSLLVTQEMLLSGRTLAEFGLNEKEFALSGGGFPIRMKDAGVAGAIVVSGLPQTHDHQLIVDALAEYLHVDAESVLV